MCVDITLLCTSQFALHVVTMFSQSRFATKLNSSELRVFCCLEWGRGTRFEQYIGDREGE